MGVRRLIRLARSWDIGASLAYSDGAELVAQRMIAAPTALRQTVSAIRVRGGLPFLARQQLLAAGAWVRADGRDEVWVGVTVAEFERATGVRVMETAV